MPQLTSFQHDAIHTHDRNLIVVAGAGSGKTYVLVERYLALLDRHPDWQLNQLVAITFTQKAAQEMRDRVREALAERFEVAPDAEQAALWSARLNAMDSARIDTIHAMCASILRANAAEAGIDPGFEVLDEVEAQLLLEDAIDDALRAMVAEGHPALELFREYDARTVRAMLAEFVAAEPNAPPDNLFERWTEAWRAGVFEYLQALFTDAAFVDAAGWQPPGGFPKGDDLILNVWMACHPHLETLRSDADLQTLFDALAQLKATINLKGGKAAIWGDKETLEDAKAMLRLLRDYAEDTLKQIGDPPGDADHRAAALLPHWYAAICRVQDVYRRARLDRAALDFDDLERLTRDVLRDYPHVRARYAGNEFRHVLVDEFQDTNAVQWQIVQALAPLELAGSLFVVGDPKQSIYAFRGADVSVFEQVRGQITNGHHWYNNDGDANNPNGAGSPGMEIPLARSFRTHRVLVDGFNTVFERILVRDERSPARAYQTTLDTRMEAHRDSPPCEDAALEIVLLDKSLLGDEEGKAELARRWEAQEIARRLHAIVKQGRPVYDKRLGAERPVNYGDVAILFQSMSKITLYEDVFKGEGLPFVTVAGRGYYNRQEVWDVLNLLRALHNPADALALVAALRSPIFSLSDDALLALRFWADDAREGNAPEALWLWDALAADNSYLPPDELSRVRFAAECLHELRRIAGRVTISELLAEALDRTGYLAVLTSLPDGARRRGNVEKLLEKAQSSGKISLGAFTQYLKDLSDREVREGEAALEGEGAVKLMTVHKSKGLEFPVVVLADCSWSNPAGGGAALAYDPAAGLACRVYDHAQNRFVSTFAYSRVEQMRRAREDAERRRLLYVAATRAQDLLILSGQVSREKSGALKADGWLSWLVDALDVRDLEPLERQMHACDWGIVDVRFPAPGDIPRFTELNVSTEWDDAPLDDTLPVLMPPLLATVPEERDAPARALSTTQLADLGSAIYANEADRATFIERWRRSVLHDAPSRIERVTVSSSGTSARRVGEIVHKALRWWRPGTTDDVLRARLDAYAWEEGIVLTEQREESVQQAYRLMQRVLASDVEAWSASARQVFRELPFVFQTGKRLIHGVIDLLMEREDGQWVLVDYKTSFVSWEAGAPELEEHARRYHLQLGIYASAARELLGTDSIAVYIHYIRHEQTVAIPVDIWQSALEHLEDHIGTLVEMDDL